MQTRRSLFLRPPSPIDEERLVRRAQSGDRSAFDELVRHHYAGVHATAFRLVGNPEDAEDLAQECFVRAHGALKWFRGEGSLRGWLRRILVHLAHDRFRREGRRPERQELPASLEAAGHSGPAQELGARELTRFVEEALARLPEHQRVALVLRTREGLEYQEIARLTGVTPATARTQVMKARRALLSQLAPYMEPRER